MSEPRDSLVDAVHAAWTRWDPPPDNLAETILVGLAMDDLDAQYELLTLVHRHNQLAGTRSSASDADRILIEFRSGDLTVLVRVAQDDAGGLRLDGWVTPATGGSVTVVQGEWSSTVPLDANGRFGTPTTGRGLTQLIVQPTASPVEGEFRTTLFEI